MVAAQRIYGPHGDAVVDVGEFAIGRCIYETLPEDRYDRGPVESADGRYLLVGDVRLDDRDALADALDLPREVGAGLCDAAFLVRAWERWQEACFGHLYGDYAFALWDTAERRLILARDHIGSRPLHYHVQRDFIAFASMPKGLHALPDIPYAPNQARVAEMLALVPEVGPSSFFSGIQRVEGGHYVAITRDGSTSHRHWDPTPDGIGTWHGDDPVEALRAHLDRAVAACLRGAGDSVGAHLSAGFDSAAVAATAARLRAPDGRVTAFTAVPRKGYEGPAPERRIIDEGPLAAATAALYPNIDHVLVRGTSRAVNEGWDNSFYLLDRPLLNPCNDRWWTAINAEAARRGIHVMLTGEMGNMTLSFIGVELLPELVRKGAWRALWREGRALVRNRQMRWKGFAASAFGPWVPVPIWAAIQRRYAGWRRRVEDYTALRADHAKAMDLERLARSRGLDLSYRPRKNAFESRLWVMRRIDKGNFQKAALGGYGVDQRDPTADRRLIEFCLSLPTSLFLANGEFRALGTRALADRLPEEVLTEPRRGYQGADWHEGLAAAAEELSADLAGLEELPAASMLDLNRMRRLVANLPTQGWERSKIIEDYRLTLLRGSAIGHFLRRASRTNR